MRLLLVEDDRMIGESLVRGLRDDGYAVDWVRDGAAAMSAFKDRQADFSIAILDWNLPRQDGLSVLKAVRSSGSALPILMITARDGLTDRVNGLDSGADDYLVKPFAFSELLARVRSLLRRRGASNAELLQFADLSLHVRRHQVMRSGVPIELTPKEFLLLALLLEHQGNVLSRTLIAEQVWDMAFDTDSNVVDVHIRRLRAKMDDPFERKLIHTVRGLGYVLR